MSGGLNDQVGTGDNEHGTTTRICVILFQLRRSESGYIDASCLRLGSVHTFTTEKLSSTFKRNNVMGSTLANNCSTPGIRKKLTMCACERQSSSYLAGLKSPNISSNEHSRNGSQTRTDVSREFTSSGMFTSGRKKSFATKLKTSGNALAIVRVLRKAGMTTLSAPVTCLKQPSD